MDGADLVCFSSLCAVTTKEMSIAYDVSREMARRIADEARDNDKCTVAVYWESEARDDHPAEFLPLFVAWRHLSSPGDLIYVKLGQYAHFHQPFGVKSMQALKSLLIPPGHNRADLTLLYVVLPGEQPIPETLSWSEGTSLDTVVNAAFPRRSLDEYVDTQEEGGIEEFLGGDEFLSFVWNLLS